MRYRGRASVSCAAAGATPARTRGSPRSSRLRSYVTNRAHCARFVTEGRFETDTHATTTTTHASEGPVSRADCAADRARRRTGSLPSPDQNRTGIHRRGRMPRWLPSPTRSCWTQPSCRPLQAWSRRSCSSPPASCRRVRGVAPRRRSAVPELARRLTLPIGDPDNPRLAQTRALTVAEAIPFLIELAQVDLRPSVKAWVIAAHVARRIHEGAMLPRGNEQTDAILERVAGGMPPSSHAVLVELAPDADDPLAMLGPQADGPQLGQDRRARRRSRSSSTSPSTPTRSGTRSSARPPKRGQSQAARRPRAAAGDPARPRRALARAHPSRQRRDRPSPSCAPRSRRPPARGRRSSAPWVRRSTIRSS